MVLFRRLPRFRPPSSQEEIIPAEEQNNYPDFASDFRTLQNVLLPAFRELDDEALRSQNLYRWIYIILILGGALVTIVAIVQIALLNYSWIAFIGTAIAILMAAATGFLQSFKYQERYFNARLGAERLRSEYFLFLSYSDLYANNLDRVQKLEQRIIEIRREVEGGDIA